MGFGVHMRTETVDMCTAPNSDVFHGTASSVSASMDKENTDSDNDDVKLVSVWQGEHIYCHSLWTEIHYGQRTGYIVDVASQLRRDVLMKKRY